MFSHDIHAASTTSHERGERDESGGGRGGRSPATHCNGVSLFHAASTVTTSTRPARPVTRGGQGRGKGGEGLQPSTQHWRGDDNDLVSLGQHDYIQSRPATGEMGEGRGKAGGDNDLVCQHDQSFTLQRVEGGKRGDDNDFVSRGQRDHIQPPAPQRVRGGREGEGGSDNDLLLRGQHDHIQSPATQWTYKRLCWRLFRSFLEVVSCVQSRGRGDGGEGGLGV